VDKKAKSRGTIMLHLMSEAGMACLLGQQNIANRKGENKNKRRLWELEMWHWC